MKPFCFREIQRLTCPVGHNPLVSSVLNHIGECPFPPVPAGYSSRYKKSGACPSSLTLRLRCVRALASCKVTIIATQTRRKAMTTNCIKFTSYDIETAKGVGSISTQSFDFDIAVEPVASSSPMAPTHTFAGPRRRHHHHMWDFFGGHITGA